MSDFRVPLQKEYNPEFDFELDWNESQRQWKLSYRERGFGKSWTQDQDPSPDQLLELIEFFRISPDNLQLNVLGLSPGELTLIHSNSAKVISVYAALCTDCSRHWFVFRWEDDKKRWNVYGRNCDFSWRRGGAPQGNEVEMLRSVRHNIANPLTQPKGNNAT